MAASPADFGGILDDAGANERVDGALIMGVACEARRQTSARQVVEDRQAVGFEPSQAAEKNGEEVDSAKICGRK